MTILYWRDESVVLVVGVTVFTVIFEGSAESCGCQSRGKMLSFLALSHSSRDISVR